MFKISRPFVKSESRSTDKLQLLTNAAAELPPEIAYQLKTFELNWVIISGELLPTIKATFRDDEAPIEFPFRPSE